MTSITFFLFLVPSLAFILLAVNLVLAPHSPYQEKNSPFECGFHSFLGQNRTQFSISFFIFALLFLLFDLEILLVYPYAVSGYSNDIYGLVIMLIFFLALTLGFSFEFGKNALKIDSRQVSKPVDNKLKVISVHSAIFPLPATTSPLFLIKIIFKLYWSRITFKFLLYAGTYRLLLVAFLLIMETSFNLSSSEIIFIRLFAALTLLQPLILYYFNEICILVRKCNKNDLIIYTSLYFLLASTIILLFTVVLSLLGFDTFGFNETMIALEGGLGITLKMNIDDLLNSRPNSPRPGPSGGGPGGGPGGGDPNGAHLLPLMGNAGTSTDGSRANAGTNTANYTADAGTNTNNPVANAGTNTNNPVANVGTNTNNPVHTPVANRLTNGNNPVGPPGTYNFRDNQVNEGSNLAALPAPTRYLDVSATVISNKVCLISNTDRTAQFLRMLFPGNWWQAQRLDTGYGLVTVLVDTRGGNAPERTLATFDPATTTIELHAPGHGILRSLMEQHRVGVTVNGRETEYLRHGPAHTSYWKVPVRYLPPPAPAPAPVPAPAPAVP